MLRMEFQKIEGWLTHEEAMFLYDLACESNPAGVMVEVGSYLGKSSVVIGQAAMEKNMKLYCVDDFHTGVSFLGGGGDLQLDTNQYLSL